MGEANFLAETVGELEARLYFKSDDSLRFIIMDSEPLSGLTGETLTGEVFVVEF